MFIVCNSCKTKFDIDQNLIPIKGRLLQCNKCNHKWFFKNEIAVKTIEPVINENMQIFEDKNPQLSNLKDIYNKISNQTEEIVKKVEINKTKIQKKNNILNLTIVFIISSVAVIIFIDTFKYPLSKIVPNLEFLLYNLFESIKDIALFVKNLI